MTDTSTGTTTGRDGFDFVLGEWLVSNRKWVDMLDPDSEEWFEFPSKGVHRASWQRWNIETYETHELPGVGEFHGLALRLYDPTEDLWRIWWSSTLTPGKLDPPLEGRCDGALGTFVTDDVIAGRPIKGVRVVRPGRGWRELGAGVLP